MAAPASALRLPAYVINGIAVALGIGVIQIVVGQLLGHAAAVAASSAAVCTSLADLPNATRRTWYRVSTAGLVACAVSALVAALHASPLGLGLALALIAFASALALAWGPRAGPISFVGILSFVFTMAAPAAPWLMHLGWTLLGAALYLGWALAASALLQPRYRTLALASVLDAVAQLLRARAALLAQAEEPASAGGALPLQERIRGDAVLDECLQAARDLLFAAREDDPAARRQTALLLLAIDLRDTLLASELDLDLLGHDAPAAAARRALATNLGDIAGALYAMQLTLRGAQNSAQTELGAALRGSGADAHVLPHDLPHDDVRARLIPVLLDRARRMVDDVAQMRALMHQASDARVPLERAQLQLFVSVEGWPLAALRPHRSLRSPVTRHALRSAAALGSAYTLAQWLPWSSHPYWLVLGVAVVLRGNLEQTLARRDARVAGTVIGCLLVLMLGQLSAAWLSALVFLVAVGIAHSYVTARYLVTAAAASVMALLQAHLAQPLSGFAIPERLADTLLGALLAWGFSYVLPSWERRALPRIVARLLRAQANLARHALRWPDGDDLALRLARRDVYDALASLAATTQRTRVEPESVRVPLYALASLLGASHALLAHLAAVKLLLARRAGELERREAEAVLQHAAAEVLRCLESAREAQAPAPADAAAVPGGLPADALLPWLRRRLQLATHSAAQVAHAARALLTTGLE
jgi:uncharacterized membrane protein YccC